MAGKTKRFISSDNKSFLLALEPTDINTKMLVRLFANSVDRTKKTNGKLTMIPSMFETEDRLILDKGEYFNKEKIETTVGLFIFNKFLIERELQESLGYVNETLTDSGVNKLTDKLSADLIVGKITVMNFANFIDNLQQLAQTLAPIICGSLTEKTMIPDKKVIAHRKKLLSENKEALENGDAIVAAKIEKELVKLQTDTIKDDPGMDLYNSGARGSVGNNLKDMIIMKGPILNPSTGKYDIITSNFTEGIQKKDIPAFANSVITASYPKAVGTATAGYFSKQIIAGMQGVVLDNKGTDCKTTRTLNVEMTEANYTDYRLRYIQEGKELKLITDDKIKNYIGKNVKMRSTQYCIGKNGICNKCAGDMYYGLHIKNAGLTTARASSTLLNLQMKKFHDTSMKVHDIDIDDMIL